MTIAKLQELAFEHGLEIVGPDSNGYKYIALETEDGHDVYRAPDVVWEKILPTNAATADPAAGANPASITVPAGKKWLLMSLYGTLVTDGTAANRYANIYVRHDGTNNDQIFGATIAHTAGATVAHCWSNGHIGADAGGVGLGYLIHELGQGAELAPASVLLFSTTGLQAADDWSAVRYVYKEAPA